MPDEKAAPAQQPAAEYPMHVDEFAFHNHVTKTYTAELLGGFMHWCRQNGRVVHTATDFHKLIDEFAHAPAE